MQQLSGGLSRQNLSPLKAARPAFERPLKRSAICHESPIFQPKLQQLLALDPTSSEETVLL